MVVTLGGLGLGVPLSPGAGWQAQAVEVSIIAFLPEGSSLSEPLSCLPPLSLTSSRFSLACLALGGKAADGALQERLRSSPQMALPEWGLPL